MFGMKRCSRCLMNISPNELVMRARDLVYHLTCFTCYTCNKPLNTGDYFGMKDDTVYCQAHYEVMLHEEFMSPCHFPPGSGADLNGLSPDGAMHQLPYITGMNAPQKGRPRKRKNSQPSPDACVHSLGKFLLKIPRLIELYTPVNQQCRMQYTNSHTKTVCHKKVFIKHFFTKIVPTDCKHSRFINLNSKCSPAYL